MKVESCFLLVCLLICLFGEFEGKPEQPRFAFRKPQLYVTPLVATSQEARGDAITNEQTRRGQAKLKLRGSKGQEMN